MGHLLCTGVASSQLFMCMNSVILTVTPVLFLPSFFQMRTLRQGKAPGCFNNPIPKVDAANQNKTTVYLSREV